MKTIGFVTQKGGAGKSTSALALAGALAQKYRVLLVDLDRQRSIERWSEGANLPETLEVFTATQANDLRHLPRADFVVVDTAGGLSAEVLSFLDLVLLPCAPSVFDIWAVAETVELVKAHQAHRPGLLAALFVNRLSPRTKLGKEAADALSDYGIPVLSSALHDRIAFPTSIAQGKTPVTSGNSGARLDSLIFAEEIKRLVENG
ncbi:AAA family ATPase [Pseudomonas savastanoi]|uniref:CobQ/CobB/MinD/ParA nucleotide binding domain-containing protein n=2 Tax=Pseudomonas savastanoi TaxID=29438 RepID=A0AB74BD53_PSESS|nr:MULTISPECIES: AAA family ATPase [Pseudomonas syringae group]KPW70069.1 hypothetical protein ALO78_200132 [Pseudomonas amygdali pv. ciccaronei]KPY76882.1 hypothetical protein ALO58_200142 [Pseudomonas savastanoi pv. savastanoi]MCQ3023215.1 AAA family ATPase [Pseudomonas savastanoi]OSR69188.1 hypothetical protein BV327_04155 [Pseudomonas syringae pv. actinidiae]RML91308.1 ATPase involved in chromosome partitioning [Pseudomonas savastanoi]